MLCMSSHWTKCKIGIYYELLELESDVILFDDFVVNIIHIIVSRNFKYFCRLTNESMKKEDFVI